jgi:type III pantothenate kinase
MNLLIDIGNSRLKWGLNAKDSAQIIAGEPMLHSLDDFQSQLFDQWSKIEPPQNIAISSVAENQTLEKVMAIARRFWPQARIINAKSSKQALGVVNAYQNAEKLGVDRWVTLLALRKHYPLPVYVVDCGTAITVDALDNQGLHLGGLIAPGLKLMQQSLAQGTQNLELIESLNHMKLENTTDSAISSGTLMAAVGLIELLVRQQGEEFKLLLTGGDAPLLTEHLTVQAVIEPNLVLMGLAVLLDDTV